MPASSPDGFAWTEPVMCRACEKRYPERPGTHCPECGSPLPRPNLPRLPPPPAPPRRIPWSYLVHALLGHAPALRRCTQYVGLGLLLWVPGLLVLIFAAPHVRGIWLLGAGFLAVGLVSGAIGFFESRHEIDVLRGRLRVLARGVAAKGTILSTRRDWSRTMRGRYPYHVEYTFLIGGRPVKGSSEVWSVDEKEWRAGMPVWLVYAPGDPATTSIWPPVG